MGENKEKDEDERKIEGLEDSKATVFVEKLIHYGHNLSKKVSNILISKKAIPLYLLTAAFYVSSFRESNFLFSEGKLNEELLHGKLQSILSLANESFMLGSTIKITTTLLVISALWASYFYWLRDHKYLKKSSDLLKKIIFVGTSVIILYRHVETGSPLTKYTEWIILILALYIELAGTWFTAKVIDHIDLSSDLKNWTLRLVSLPTFLVGAAISITSTPIFSLTQVAGLYSNLIFLGGLLLMALGTFMIYRSTRRQPALKVW